MANISMLISTKNWQSAICIYARVCVLSVIIFPSFLSQSVIQGNVLSRKKARCEFRREHDLQFAGYRLR